MLYLIGLGLHDENDMTLKGLNKIKKSEKIYVEFYTAKLSGTTIEKIENLTQKKITILKREEVEDKIIPLQEAKNKQISFLTAGDPLIATTHIEMIIKAKQEKIQTEIIHAPSILTAAPGLSGLQVYKFGKTTTIPFPEDNYFPKSPYHTIKNNLEQNAHTLVLLDIQAHKNKYMTINQALEYLQKIENEEKTGIITPKTLAIGIAKAGSQQPEIKADYIEKLINYDFGNPLHTLIIPSELHFLESEYLIEMANAPQEILQK